MNKGEIMRAADFKYHTGAPVAKFHWDTGAPVARAQDANYACIDTCDGCRSHGVHGTMLHATGATGRVCPVLCLCVACMAPVDAKAAA